MYTKNYTLLILRQAPDPKPCGNPHIFIQKTHLRNIDQNQNIISELKNTNKYLRDIEKHLGKIAKCLD